MALSKEVKEYFNGKNITLMGLGLLGRGIGDAKFLAETGSNVLVTDLKTEKELTSSVKVLKNFKNIKFVLGQHRIEDFKNTDLVIKGAGVPLDSPFINEAVKNNVPVKMSTAIFAKFTDATVIGVTGTRGKSTTAHLIHYILNRAGKRTYLGGNIRGLSTISLLKKVKKGDYVVLELDSWQLQGFEAEKISPHISVFTTFMPDHMNYYKGDLNSYFKDKANIFKFQKENDFLITTKNVSRLIHKNGKTSSLLIVVNEEVPDWEDFKVFGNHNKINVSLAVAAAEKAGVSRDDALEIAKNFRGVPGRLEYLRSVKGVKFFNDTTATTPEASLAGIKALYEKFGVKPVAIIGGNDKGLNSDFFVKNLHKYAKAVILLPGTGTLRIKGQIVSNKKIDSFESKDLKSAFKQALMVAKKGDIVSLTPGFSSFGLFKNEFDRGDKFNNLVSKLV